MSDSTRRPPHEKWAIVDDPSNIAKFLAQVPRSTATRYPAPPNTTTSLNEGTDNGGNLAASSMTSLNESRHADTSEGANTVSDPTQRDRASSMTAAAAAAASAPPLSISTQPPHVSLFANLSSVSAFGWHTGSYFIGATHVNSLHR